ncbi:potassium-transporting ATPase subunit KdpC [Hathewaya histolytica]|uniref:Potassium-transporting ATPase KdpC subunit n=1 Tax=Hathewaya histolytica TaxID=1498 RepID=A0A4V6KC06_HATHI|nr:potassium-transporting ATPase subunit KdpC [Hathewaya histolytica]VTQ84547.1 potassium-transporting ATPase subunit C [Hathewaya histolytica]
MKIVMKAFRMSIVFLIICGFLYPLVITGLGNVITKKNANGSIIDINGKEVGSEILGQEFRERKYFHGRVSSINYNIKDKSEDNNEVASGASNLAPSNKELIKRVDGDIKEFLKNNPSINKDEITAELLTNSSSGLDPHITPKGAQIQIPSVSKYSGLSETELNALVKKHTEKRQFGVLGEERVNVLNLNLDIYKKLSEK